jgi:membrane associated rhomboid family serine protease
MFPIGDDNSSRRTFPVVTYALIALNLLFFFAELNGGDAFIQKWSFVPRRFLANPVEDLPTLFSSMFMHAGWMHLLGNMLYLWIFGDNVEDRFGHLKFAIFYLVLRDFGDVRSAGFQLRVKRSKPWSSGAIAACSVHTSQCSLAERSMS